MKKFFRRLRAILNSRALWTVLCVFVMFSLLIRTLYSLQIVNADEEAVVTYEDTVETTTTSGVRGNIYDCYGRALAVNTTSESLYFDVNTDVTDEELNEAILKLLEVLEEQGETLSIQDELPIAYDEYSGFYYTDNYANATGTARLNFLAEIYGTKRADLTDEEAAATAEDAYIQMRDETFEIDDSLPQETILAIMEIRFVFYEARWTPEDPVLVAQDLNEETQAIILEQNDTYIGFYVETEYTRYYPEGEYFAHIIGYVGSINEEELEELEDEGYTENDIIGKTGLEASYEDYLRGESGVIETTYSGETGEVISTETIVAATSGNDLILTIDADFQKECYEILYENIKDLILEKITGVSEENNLAYSALDVVCALMTNGFFDTDVIQESDLEEAVAFTELYNEEADATIEELRSLLLESSTDIADYDDLTMEYFDVVISYMRDYDYLSTDYRDDTSTIYVSYVSGETTALEFLEYCYNGGYFDLDEFAIDDFDSSDDGLPIIIDTVLEAIRHNTDYEQLVFTSLLLNDLYEVKDFILMCYDLGFLSNDDSSRDEYEAGSLSLLNLLKNKIENDEITPADINLDPCSGSMIVTDCDTGEVKAIVSYPSYDPNEYLNDYDYFVKVSNDATSPMLFRALQESRAPGSTYKMVTSIAALELGYITVGDYVYDAYEYENVNSTQLPTCWSETSHGYVNVIEALEVSCNYFFYEVGYLLCDPDDDGVFSDDVGLEKLSYYAELLGLSTETGIELSEVSPTTSTTDAVRSAIGQGSNSFTVANINRYTNTIANGGYVYDLYLVDHVQTSDGTIVEQTEPEAVSYADISEETLEIVIEGMELVNSETSDDVLYILEEYGITSAGKTGTAEESSIHPEHSWYTGYTNVDDPDISVTINIPYGNGSNNALPIFRDTVLAYYNIDVEIEDEDED